MDPPNFELDEFEISNLKSEDNDVIEINPINEPNISEKFKSSSAYLLCYRDRNYLNGEYPKIPDQIMENVLQKNEFHEKIVLEHNEK